MKQFLCPPLGGNIGAATPHHRGGPVKGRVPLLLLPLLVALAMGIVLVIPVKSQGIIIWDFTDEYNCEHWSFGCSEEGSIVVPYMYSASSFYVWENCDDAALFIELEQPSWLLVQDLNYTEILSITPESGVGPFEVGVSTEAWNSYFMLTQTPWYTDTLVSEMYIECYDSTPTPEPTPTPVLEEIIIGETGDFVIYHDVSYGEAGIIVLLAILAGISALSILVEVVKLWLNSSRGW